MIGSHTCAHWAACRLWASCVCPVYYGEVGADYRADEPCRNVCPAGFGCSLCGWRSDGTARRREGGAWVHRAYRYCPMCGAEIARP